MNNIYEYKRGSISSLPANIKRCSFSGDLSYEGEVISSHTVPDLFQTYLTRFDALCPNENYMIIVAWPNDQLEIELIKITDLEFTHVKRIYIDTPSGHVTNARLLYYDESHVVAYTVSNNSTDPITIAMIEITGTGNSMDATAVISTGFLINLGSYNTCIGQLGEIGNLTDYFMLTGMYGEYYGLAAVIKWTGSEWEVIATDSGFQLSETMLESTRCYLHDNVVLGNNRVLLPFYYNSKLYARTICYDFNGTFYWSSIKELTDMSHTTNEVKALDVVSHGLRYYLFAGMSGQVTPNTVVGIGTGPYGKSNCTDYSVFWCSDIRDFNEKDFTADVPTGVCNINNKDFHIIGGDVGPDTYLYLYHIQVDLDSIDPNSDQIDVGIYVVNSILLTNHLYYWYAIVNLNNKYSVTVFHENGSYGYRFILYR